MRTTQAERIRANEVSAAVDQLLRDPEAQLQLVDPQDADLLSTARRLARLPALLGPVDPALEQEIMRQVRKAGAPLGGMRQRRVPGFRLGWAVAVLVVIVGLVMLLTPLGQTAVASFMAVFNLGRTQVRVEPLYTPSALPATAVVGSNAVIESLTLEEAQSLFPFAIPQPAYLPSGYELKAIKGYTYPDLPAWLPQPLFVELVYADDQKADFVLRVYPIMLGEQATTTGLNLQASPIRDAKDVEINGRPGVLLRLDFERGVVYQEVVWEQGDLILALSTLRAAEDELLRIARSVGGGQEPGTGP